MNAPAITAHHLNIGDMVLGRAPNILSTLLGSCVAVTMYEPCRRIGAMCHCALPKCRSAHKCRSRCGQAGKHVDCAIRVMLHHFSVQKILGKDIQVKLFGGANMLMQMDKGSCILPIGSMNNESARRIITRNGLTIMAADTGGKKGRKILFDISTGKVSVSRIGRPPLLQPENRRAAKDMATRCIHSGESCDN